MVLHIGEDATVPLDRVILIINARGIQPRTRAFLDKAVKERRYEPSKGVPKSYVVVRERGREVVHASLIASSTLEQRARAAGVLFPGDVR